MKKIITFLCVLIGLTTYSQSELTNVLSDLQWDLRLGCCADDTDNHPDFPDCNVPDFQEYYVVGNGNINDNHLRLSNTVLTIQGDFYATEGAVTFSDNCTSELIIEGDLIIATGVIDVEHENLTVLGNIINESLSLPLLEYSKNINVGEPYIVYNSLGQMVKVGLYKGKSDLFSQEIRFIRFPKLNYKGKMILIR